MANRRSQRRTTRPVCEALESRALLNAATMLMPHVHLPAAQIHASSQSDPAPSSILQNLTPLSFSPVSTVPSNGDLNPYGVAFVPKDFPSSRALNPGDVLVSNFNNNANQQGTGSTIVDIHPDGSQSLFFQDSSPSGLDTALGVLKSGFVIVGNLPVTYNPDGTIHSIGQGSLRILDKNGNVVKKLTDSQLDGPWDLTINDQGSTAQVFVSNVLSGTVTRLDLTISPSNSTKPIKVTREVQIASGYTHQTDPAALVLGPTGLAFDAKKNVLYVASTADNEIFAIRNAAMRRTDAGKGTMVFQDPRLRGPLGLVLAPNGDLITANGDAVNADPDNIQNSELVEFNPKNGKFVAQFQIDTMPGGAFGLAISPGTNPKLAAVDDVNNTLEEFAIS